MDVGTFAFSKKKMELFCIAAYMFMFGDRSGMRHMALQTLLPLVQAATFDATAKQ